MRSASRNRSSAFSSRPYLASTSASLTRSSSRASASGCSSAAVRSSRSGSIFRGADSRGSQAIGSRGGSSGVSVLTIPEAKSDIPGTKAKVQAAFKANKSLDGFLGLDPDVTIPCLDVIPKGTKAGTFDVGGSIKEIQAGRMLFAIDQQQYLQGYLPVVFAVLYKTNLNTVGNGKPVLTGPGIINKANAAKVAALAAKGTR